MYSLELTKQNNLLPKYDQANVMLAPTSKALERTQPLHGFHYGIASQGHAHALLNSN